MLNFYSRFVGTLTVKKDGSNYRRSAFIGKGIAFSYVAFRGPKYSNTYTYSLLFH